MRYLASPSFWACYRDLPPNVDEDAQKVRIEVIGFKIGNVLFVRDKRREL
jgi:hypothetical protein